MSEMKLWYLQQIDLFKDLPKAKVKAVESCFFMRKYKKREMIVEPGDEPKVYVTKSGMVELYNVNLDGKKVIIETLKPGSIWGHWEKEQAGDYFVEAATDAYVCSLDKENFFKVLSDYPEVAAKLVQHLMARLNFAHERISSLANDQAMNKLVRLFLQLGKQFGRKEEDKIIITEKFTHEQLSQMLGISRQTVTTLINCLDKEGLISRKGKKFQFNKAALEEIA